MEKLIKWKALIALCISVPFLASCTYNPLSNDNITTGSATGALIGAGIGTGGVALLGGSKPYMFLAGLTGAALGYYVTTLRYDAGGVIQGGGQVYQVGNDIGIYIPADNLFEPTTDDFTPTAPAILDSAATVLQRYPDNNILVSGSTSGYGLTRWQQRLSLRRAQKVASYLWNSGISQFKDSTGGARKLTYTGYGDFFPLASDHSNEGRRLNNRIQITSYPSSCNLGKNKQNLVSYNVGDTDDSSIVEEPANRCKGKDC